MLVQFFLWFSFFISLRLVFLDSVMIIGLFRLVLSLSICFLIRAFFSSWFRVISVVVYVGGLLIIFCYFLAVCPNQAISSKGGLFLVRLIMSGLMLGASDVKVFSNVRSGLNEIDYMYVVDRGLVLIILVVVLLVALLSVVGVVNLSQGPLRPFSN